MKRLGQRQGLDGGDLLSKPRLVGEALVQEAHRSGRVEDDGRGYRQDAKLRDEGGVGFCRERDDVDAGPEVHRAPAATVAKRLHRVEQVALDLALVLL